MRALLKVRRAHLFIFKALEILSFFALIYFISFQNADYAVITLLAATGIYSLVVSNGMAIYLSITKNFTAPSILLFLVCASTLFFAYLAYTTFTGGVDLFKSCSQCCEDYAALRASCSNASAPTGQNQTADSGLNIPVPG